MKNLRKQARLAVALSAMALSMIGMNEALAEPKSAVIKPNPPTATEVETGQRLIKSKPGASAASPGLCGLPYTPPCVTDSPAVDVETGQKLIKDKPIQPAAAGTTAPKTGDGTPVDAPAAEVETGQLLDKGCRWPRPVDCRKATARRANDAPGNTPPSTAAPRN